MSALKFDPVIWGPPYWFVLHTMALTYPANPNDVVKKKYYDFLHNLPIFLPVSEIGNQFSGLLDKYPVTPYLDSQPSFVKWMHFIHNKINVQLGLKEQTMDQSSQAYWALYVPKAVANLEDRKRREKYIFLGLICCLFVGTAFTFAKKINVSL